MHGEPITKLSRSLSISGLVTGSTEADHLKNLDVVLSELSAAGLHLNRSKYFFLKPSMEYLGHIIDERGHHPTTEKVQAIQEAPKPKNVAELRSFWALSITIVGFYLTLQLS